MPDFADPSVWMSLLTLTFLEIVLGIDNIIFIAIAAGKLPENEQKKATNIGLALAMILRIVLLFGVSYLVAMADPWFDFGEKGSDWYGAFSGQSLILILGGIFLIYKSTTEIHHKIEGEEADEEIVNGKKSGYTLTNAIIQITLINIVFSFDSILTAVGMTNGLSGALLVMIIAVVVSVVIMMAFATAVGRFVNRNPTVQMLGMAFLILIGMMLILEGAHIGHLTIAGSEVGAVPKGYLYFAIAFSLFVEFLNMKLRKNGKKQANLHSLTDEAVRQGKLKG